MGSGMIMIGEKINGAIPSSAALIAARDADGIAELARRQVAAGAHYLDVCAGTTPEEELGALLWLIDVVQGAVDTAKTPLCVDSPNPRILAEVLPHVTHPGIVNSISLEGEKCDVLLPVLAGNPGWQAIALCCDNTGLASTADDKVRLATELVSRAKAAGVAPERLHIDPLVLAVSAAPEGAVEFIRAIPRIKEANPGVRVVAAVSNVSFGMPARSVINRYFLAMAMEAGLDTAIIDPTLKSVTETLYATAALLGTDRCGRKYNGAYRKGLIGTKK